MHVIYFAFSGFCTFLSILSNKYAAIFSHDVNLFVLVRKMVDLKYFVNRSGIIRNILRPNVETIFKNDELYQLTN